MENRSFQINMENNSQTVPASIIQAGPTQLEIVWSDGHKSSYSTYDLRIGCRCANCVDEWNGTPKLNRENIPTDVHPVTVESVGRYGLKMVWSDGHSTGIYSFDYLREICGCENCKKRKV